MRRYIPEVRALYERVRRPAIMVLVGLGFMAPMGLTILRPDSPAPASVALDTSASEATAASTGADSKAAEPRDTPAGSKDGAGVAAEAESKPEAEVTEAKSAARAEEKATSSRAAAPASATRYAKQFRIPVSLADQIHRAAVAEGIEPRVAFGLVQTESSFRRTAISSVGAVGYTQLLPSTARWIAPGTKRSDLFHPQTNLRVGFKYLNYLKKKYNGNMRLALTAYNRGPGTVDRLLKQGRNPENGYATKVLRSRG